MNDKPIKVLLIEDNLGDINLIRESLKGSRIQLKIVERLDHGLQELANEEYDGVLLDLGLPDSKGLETLDKAHKHAPRTPIVLLTGVEDEALGIEAIRRGAQDYRVKGQTDGDRLARSLRYAIGRQHVQNGGDVTNAQIMVRLEMQGVKQEEDGEKIEEIHTIIHGNSNPAKGIAFRLLQAEGSISIMKKVVWIVLGAALTGAVGGGIALFFTLVQRGLVVSP